MGVPQVQAPAGDRTIEAYEVSASEDCERLANSANTEL